MANLLGGSTSPLVPTSHSEFGLVAWGSRRDALLAPWPHAVSAAEPSASPGTAWKLGKELLRAGTNLLYAPVFPGGVCVGKTALEMGHYFPWNDSGLHAGCSQRSACSLEPHLAVVWVGSDCSHVLVLFRCTHGLEGCLLPSLLALR